MSKEIETTEYLKQLLSDHENGLYTCSELVSKIIETAYAIEIEKIIKNIPQEIVDEIKELKSIIKPAKKAEDIFIVHYASEEMQQRLFISDHKWHNYFYKQSK